MIKQRKLFESFGFASRGIALAFKENQNLRIHFLAALIVLLAGFILKVTYFELSMLVVMILFVITSEMVNTAIEEVVNLLTNEHHKEAEIAKDVAAGMVLVSSIGAVIVGLFIFIPHIVTIFH